MNQNKWKSVKISLKWKWSIYKNSKLENEWNWVFIVYFVCLKDHCVLISQLFKKKTIFIEMVCPFISSSYFFLMIMDRLLEHAQYNFRNTILLSFLLVLVHFLSIQFFFTIYVCPAILIDFFLFYPYVVLMFSFLLFLFRPISEFYYYYFWWQTTLIFT